MRVLWRASCLVMSGGEKLRPETGVVTGRSPQLKVVSYLAARCPFDGPCQVEVAEGDRHAGPPLCAFLRLPEAGGSSLWRAPAEAGAAPNRPCLWAQGRQVLDSAGRPRQVQNNARVSASGGSRHQAIPSATVRCLSTA